MITLLANLLQKLGKPQQLEINPANQLLHIESLNLIQKIDKLTGNMNLNRIIMKLINKGEQECIQPLNRKKSITQTKISIINKAHFKKNNQKD